MLLYLLGSDISARLEDAQLDIFGYKSANYLERVLDMLGYPVANGDFTTTDAYFYKSVGGKFATTHFNPMRLFALSRLYWDWYRQSDYETAVDPISFNLDNIASGGVS